MRKIQLNISRDKSVVAAGMPYRVYINGNEVTRLLLGQSFSTEINDEPTRLKVSLVGNALSIHKIEKEINLIPSNSKAGFINCQITTKPKPSGIFTMGLLQAPGEAEINVEYY